LKCLCSNFVNFKEEEKKNGLPGTQAPFGVFVEDRASSICQAKIKDAHSQTINMSYPGYDRTPKKNFQEE
jgi:hypothetical protein